MAKKIKIAQLLLCLFFVKPIYDLGKYTLYGFEDVTYKSVASHIKNPGRILAKEIQIKYWLPDNEVISMTGLTDNLRRKYSSIGEMVAFEQFEYIVLNGTETFEVPENYRPVAINQNKRHRHDWQIIYELLR